MKLSRAQLFLLIFVGLLVCLPDIIYGSGIGFQAHFYDPPSPVSHFEPRNQQFSVSTPPMSFAPLTPLLSFAPKVSQSYFKDNYLTFKTDITRDISLIPVAVDVTQYNEFRKNKFIDEKFASFGQKSLGASQKKKDAGGVSVGVALPKQLDRVFGEGGGNLRVSGYRRISFSGRSSWTDGIQTDMNRQSKFPTLNMDQNYRFDIEGTIGNKISVKVSEDSQTDIPLANRILLRYKGDDDDILKTIEAGNTTLSLPNTQFVGYTSRVQGLFGIKAEAKVGRLSLTAVASQEKGSSERATISEGGDEKATYYRDWEYVQNRIFELSSADFEKTPLKPHDKVLDILVYEQTQRTQDFAKARIANILIDPNADSSSTKDQFRIYVEEISSDQYTLVNDFARGKHYIAFNYSRPGYAIGVYMKVERANEDLGGKKDTVNIGDIINHGDTLYLKMLRPSYNDLTPSHPTWNLMWRNAYSIPSGLAAEDLKIKILKGADGTEGQGHNLDYQKTAERTDGTYLALLGLDQYTGDQKLVDGLVDEREDVYQSEWGLLIFPNRFPFNSDTTFTDQRDSVTPALKEKVPKIYEFKSDAEKMAASVYYIQVGVKVRSSIINLNRVNIIEGSERVTADGEVLNRDLDYRIDYSFGRITLLSARATNANAKIAVDFEYAPFLSLQKKSLVGIRSEYQFSRGFKIGSTWLHKSDKAQDRKPRVGQETAKMTVFDADASLQLHPNFLTKFANALPFITVQGTSVLKIDGELAQSHPNPNIDGSAFVDDFEAAVEQLNLGMMRADWTLSSAPVQLSPDAQRGKILWHNPLSINVLDVYDRDTEQGKGLLTPFRMIFRPKPLKIDSLQIDSTEIKIDTTHVPSWGGIMTFFGNAVDPYRAQLMELRAKGTHGIIHFDFGSISEDINGNIYPDQEADELTQMTSDLDVGLDGIADAGEPGYDPVTNPDPNGDNWYSNGYGKCPLPNNACEDDSLVNRFKDRSDPIYYEFLNGTEGNLRDEAHQGQPDRELLSRNSFNRTNAYFSYKIDLSADPVSSNSFYVPGSERNGWRTFRIPIRESSALDTSVSSSSTVPDWSQISHIRVWFESDAEQTRSDTIEIAAWYFVQSNWRDSLIVRRNEAESTKFVIASVSTEDGTFQPPPGVTAYTDETTNVTETQRGLALIYKEIMKGDTCLAFKKLPSIDRYSGYRKLQMYVHGDTSTTNHDSVKFFFRMGKDDENFYEYQTFVYPGWDERNYIDIDFNIMTALKNSALITTPGKTRTTPIDTMAGNYHIVGEPNINEIKYNAAGIVNLDSTGENPASGTIWVDELRVTDVRRDVGTAARISISGNIGDLATYSFSMQNKNPYFRGISTTTRAGSESNLGSGSTDKMYNWNISSDLAKFIPRGWMAQIPWGISFSKTIQIPVLRTASDIVLPEEVRNSEKTQSQTRGFHISESFNRKGSNPLFNFFLNRQKFNFSYSRTNSSTITRPYNFGESYSITSQMDLGISKVPGLSFLAWSKSIPLLKKLSSTRLFLYPNKWSLSGNYDRTINISDDVSYNRTSSVNRSMNGKMNIDYKIFENLSVGFDYSTRRDLSDLDQVNFSLKHFHPGLELNFNQNFNATYNPKLFSWFSTNSSYSAAYQDTYARANKSRSSTMSRSISFAGEFRHLSLLGTSKGRPPSPTSNRQSPGQQHQQSPNPRKPVPTPLKPETPKDSTNDNGGTPLYEHPLALLRFLTGWFEPITYKYSKKYNNSLPGMLERPTWKYRFGLADEAIVPVIGSTRTQTATEGETLDLSSRFKLLGGLAVQVKYATSITRDVIKQGDRLERKSNAWPNLDITIQQFERFPLIKNMLNKFISVFRPRTSYSRNTKTDKSLVKGYITSKTTSNSMSPLLSVEFRLFKSLSMTGSFGMSKTDQQRFNQENGSLVTHTKNTQKSFSLSSRYSFKAPGGLSIPIFGHLKINSLVTMEVSIRKSMNKGENWSKGVFNVNEDRSEFMVSPVISYDFSQQIKGGLTATWQDINDNFSLKKSHVRMLQIWAEMRF